MNSSLQAERDNSPIGMFSRKQTTLYADKIYDSLSECTLKINRVSLIWDAVVQIKMLKGLTCKVRVVFSDELGADYGGLTREFFTLCMQDIMISESFAYFKSSPKEGGYRMNRNIDDLEPIRKLEMLARLRFLGQLIGLAVLNKQTLPLNLTPSTYIAILRRPFTLDWYRGVDSSHAESLQYILDTENIQDIIPMTYAVPILSANGDLIDFPLIPHGETIEVTDVNKYEYVQDVVRYMVLGGDYDREIKCIRGGLKSVIPLEALREFTAEEVDLLVSGSPIIDVADWKANTVYEGCSAESDIVIWFWDYLEHKMSDTQRSSFLLFATGSPRPPVNGFYALLGDGRPQPFKIVADPWSPDGYIRAHTCFNTVDLPLTCRELLRGGSLSRGRPFHFGAKHYCPGLASNCTIVVCLPLRYALEAKLKPIKLY